MTADERSALTLFDPLAQGYEGWFETPLGAFVARTERDFILQMLGPRAGERLLEVGAGTGYFLRDVARSGARCVGLDPAEAMLSAAASRPMANVDYVCGRAEDLPFGAGAFDGVLFMTTLEFVQDEAAAIGEAARVVRPGGRLLFGVLNAEGPWASARRRQGGLWDEARFYSTEELVTLLRPFGTITTAYRVHVPPRFERLPALLLPLVDTLGRVVFQRRGALIGVRVDLRR